MKKVFERIDESLGLRLRMGMGLRLIVIPVDGVEFGHSKFEFGIEFEVLDG